MSEANQYAYVCLNECLQILFLIFLQTNPVVGRAAFRF